MVELSYSAKYDANLVYIMETGRIMAVCGTQTPNLQCKVTAFMPAEIVVNSFYIFIPSKNREIHFFQSKLSSLILKGHTSMEAMSEQIGLGFGGCGDDLEQIILEPLGLTREEIGQLRRGLER